MPISSRWIRLTCLALLPGGGLLPCAAQYRLPVTAEVRTVFAGDDDFLDYVERRSVSFFLSTQDPVTGLMPDRASNSDVCSIASVGFALSSIAIAVERGWIARAEGRARVLLTLQTLAGLPQGAAVSGVAGYRGWFYHFLDMRTGLRAWNSELSTIDTALMMWGVLDCGMFFDDSTDADEVAIRRLADTLVGRLDWSFVLRPDHRIAMSWDPVSGYNTNGWSGYNEAMCLYLLGIGAAVDPLPAESWSAWTSSYEWRTHFGHTYVWCPTGSLFTHHYSHCWIDFRGITDAALRASGTGIDYFENSRRATLAQQAYAAAKPFANYGPDEFGVTACDGPGAIIGGINYPGYYGRGAPPGPPVTFDDGTLAPTAAVSSIPFAPEACIPAARRFYDAYLPQIWSDYGFCDAFNIAAAGWFDPDVVGIDQGPIVMMIENHRTGSTWRRLLGSPVVQRGLQRAGFTAPPPGGIGATAPLPARIDVAWTDTASYETGFLVETSTDGTTFSAAASTGPGVTTVQLAAAPGTTYHVRVRSQSGSGLSGWRETVSVTTPEEIAIYTQPAGVTVPPGGAVVFSVAAGGPSPLSYQWMKDGLEIPGANGSSHTIPSARAADMGFYSVTVGSGGSSLDSAPAALIVETGTVSRLVNVSARGMMRAGDLLIPGFVLRGSGTKSLLLRAAGPALAAYGISNPQADPRIALVPLGGSPQVENDDWSAGSEAETEAIRAAAVATGAFPFATGAKDAAALATLPAIDGVQGWTVVTSSAGAAAGIALAEVYEAGGESVRLINVSTRGYCGTGDQVLIPGFVIVGGPKRLLLRAVGPGIAAAPFNVPGTMPDPNLRVIPLGRSFTVATADNWGDGGQTTALQTVFEQAGAFALAPNSLDAALVVRLPPGGYTAVVSGAGTDTGVVLVEVYDLDP